MRSRRRCGSTVTAPIQAAFSGTPDFPQTCPGHEQAEDEDEADVDKQRLAKLLRDELPSPKRVHGQISHYPEYPARGSDRALARYHRGNGITPNIIVMFMHFTHCGWTVSDKAHYRGEITESIRITESGPAETFCNRPRQMFIKP